MAVLIVAIVGLGLYPQPVLDLARPPLETLQRYVRPMERAAAPGSDALPAAEWTTIETGEGAGPWMGSEADAAGGGP